MIRLRAAALVLCAACLVACGSPEIAPTSTATDLVATTATSPAPTATDVITATPTTPNPTPTATVAATATISAALPFTISGPMDEPAAVTDGPQDYEAVTIVDLESHEFWTIRRTPSVPTSSGHVGFVFGWYRDGRLRIGGTGSQEFAVDLDTRKVEVGTQGIAPFGGYTTVSGDGAWSLERAADHGLSVVRQVDGPAAFRVVAGNPYSWSPVGHELAILGDFCTLDLLIFDPTSGALRNLTAESGTSVWGAVWRPDGSSLAVLLGNPSPNAERGLALINATTGAITHVAHFGRPRAWSPDGKRLLFGPFASGCEVDGPPTTIERIGG